jgi:hypothetical protein
MIRRAQVPCGSTMLLGGAIALLAPLFLLGGPVVCLHVAPQRAPEPLPLAA